MYRSTVRLLVVIVLALLASIALMSLTQAGTFYCDPVNGNTTTGDGSSGSPWGTLQSINEAGYFDGKLKGGDVLKLMDGHHGYFDAQKVVNRIKSDYLCIEAVNKGKAAMTGVTMKACAYWKFKGINFSPRPSSITPHPDPNKEYMLLYGYQNHHIDVEECSLFTVRDASAWTSKEWTDLTYSAIGLRPEGYCTFRNNVILNVRYGIRVHGNSLCEGNIINGFSQDAIQAFGPNTTVQDNIILNQMANTMGWHEDGIQNWGNAQNMIIRRNYIHARPDPNRTVGSSGLQGMFLNGDAFSGIVANNVVICLNGIHGITIGNANGVEILNNTVLCPHGMGGTDWPDITVYGGGQATIRNNICEYYPAASAGRISSNNINVRFLGYRVDSYFVDYLNGDVRLAPGSPAIDAGTDVGLTEDLAGDARPVGTAYDLGAYEKQGTTGIGAFQISKCKSQIDPTQNRQNKLYSIDGRLQGWLKGKHTGMYIVVPEAGKLGKMVTISH